MKRFLRILMFMALGASVMVGVLLWTSQFFGLEDTTTPVIWLERQDDEGSDP